MNLEQYFNPYGKKKRKIQEFKPPIITPQAPLGDPLGSVGGKPGGGGKKPKPAPGSAAARAVEEALDAAKAADAKKDAEIAARKEKEAQSGSGSSEQS